MLELTKQDFINAGYTIWKPNPNHELETDLFEKCVTDNIGKRYFIHVTRWDFDKYPTNNGVPIGIRYEARVQFTKKDTGNTVNINFLHGFSIDEMEKFYEDQWNTGMYRYYEEYKIGED